MRENKIRYVLRDRPHLIPVFNTWNKFPQRLKKYDKNLFIVWNVLKQRYEIHSLKSFMPRFQDWTSHQFDWYEELDDRLFNYLYKFDLKRHGDEVSKFLERENILMEQNKENIARNRVKRSIKEVMKTVKGYNTNY